MISRPKQAALDAVDALRKIARPVIAIQATAILVVVAYHFVPEVRDFSANLARSSDQAGWWGAGLSTLVASTVLPRIFQKLLRWNPPSVPTEGVGGVQTPSIPMEGGGGGLRDLLFEIGYWLFIGIEIYWFYQLQAVLFGSQPTLPIVTKKVALDMLAFTPLWNMPVSSLIFLWRDNDFNTSKTKQALQRGDLAPRVATFIVGAFGYWLPMVSAIYSLPRDIQYCLFLLAQAAWAILLLAMDRAKRRL